jgi:hypothetical protein
MFADEEDDESDSNEERDVSFKNSEEFVLPLDEFDHVVNEIADPTRASPSPVRTTKREGSMTPSVAASSRASSPEDDEGNIACLPEESPNVDIKGVQRQLEDSFLFVFI